MNASAETTVRHTPEPWKIDEDYPCDIVSEIHGHIASCNSGATNEHEDAAHIVACVNALAGLNLEGVRERLEAAKSLANEIRACWGMSEWMIREVIGNTNYQCVLDKLAAFDATALKKIEVPTMVQHDAAIEALKNAGES